jgi:hypothetical protein
VRRVPASPGQASELRSLESEITDVRRYIRRYRYPADSEKIWMQLVWIDLLLDHWLALDNNVSQCRDLQGGTVAKPGRPVRVLANAVEPLTLAGLGACLRQAPDLTVVADSEVSSRRVDVCVHATEQVDAEFMRVMQVSARRFEAPAVLVANRIEKSDLGVLAGCGVLAVLPRVAASSGRLVDTVRAVGVDRCVPGPDLLTGLREHVSSLVTTQDRP